jgi:hypothetical protein
MAAADSEPSNESDAPSRLGTTNQRQRGMMKQPQPSSLKRNEPVSSSIRIADSPRWSSSAENADRI